MSFFVGSVYDLSGLYGTSSTLDVLVDGSQIAAFTNTSVSGTSTQKWSKFSTEFAASGTKTTVAFINGNSLSDNLNWLDSVRSEQS